MNIKELLIKFQEYQLQYEVLNANCAHNAAANLFMERYGIKNCFIPDVMVANADGCPNCSKKEYHQHRNQQNNNKVRKCIWCKTVWETAP